MGPSRASKRVRAEDQMSFWDDEEEEGVFLNIKLKSGRHLKSRGWPYIQQCVRGIVGDRDKLEKASFQKDGSVLVKTKNNKQTEQLLKARLFGDEECVITKESRMNTSRGTIYAYDLIELPEEEIVKWLEGFGVVGARHFTRMDKGKRVTTPTVLLTFNKPKCPTRLVFDYITYQVRKHVPNPLICHKCGHFAHTEAGCKAAEYVCLTCGETKHEGSCSPKCINCGKAGHSCWSRECTEWKKERDICELKVDKDISFAHARREYQKAHETPNIRPYATVVRSQNETPSQADEMGLRERVQKLEERMEKALTMLNKIMEQTAPDTSTQRTHSQDETAHKIMEQTAPNTSAQGTHSQDEIAQSSPSCQDETAYEIMEQTAPNTSAQGTHSQDEIAQSSPSWDMDSETTDQNPDNHKQNPQNPDKPSEKVVGKEKGKPGNNGKRCTESDTPNPLQHLQLGPKTHSVGKPSEQGRKMPNLTRGYRLPNS